MAARRGRKGRSDLYDPGPDRRIAVSRNARLALVAAFVVVAAAAFVLARPGSDRSAGPTETATRAQTPPTRPQPPPVPLIRMVDGKPVGGPLELAVRRGQRVRFRVVSDAAAEVHVHGYDLTKQVPAGREVSFSFAARLEGIFEVEVHGTETQIAQLKVTP
jgi:hypothetical protein